MGDARRGPLCRAARGKKLTEVVTSVLFVPSRNLYSNFVTRLTSTLPPACENWYWLAVRAGLKGDFIVISMISPGRNGLR